jgi:streptogramin lyase
MSKIRRWTGAVAALTAALLVGTPAAHASRSAVVATWHLAPGFYEMHAGMGAMWVANVDEYRDTTLYRIDPDTSTITHVTTLHFPGGGMITAYGSVWITDYFGNAVWRIGTDGSVQAVIGTGLQPQWMDAAFGSLWTSNHHGASMSRIDPSTDTVVATVPVGAQHVFRNGPQAITHDANRVYVTSSNLVKLQSVDPDDNTVTTPRRGSGADQFCGELVTAGGSVWSMDLCSGALYQLGTDGSVLGVFDAGSSALNSETKLDRTLWVAEDQDPTTYSHGALVQRDPHSGDVLRFVPIGGDASTVRSGFGDLWVFDGTHNTVRRVDV